MTGSANNLSPPNGKNGGRSGSWDRAWGRILAVVQACLGVAGFVSQLLDDADRPYLLMFSVLLVSGAPATAVVVKYLLEKASK